MIQETASILAGLAWLALALAAVWLGSDSSIRVRRIPLMFAAAAGLQAGWGLAAWAGWGGLVPAVALEAGRCAAWAAFFASLLPAGQARTRRLIWGAAAGLVALRAAAPHLALLAPMDRLQIALVAELLVLVLALALTVSVLRAADDSDRWSLRFLCFPLAGLFVHDLYLYGQALSVGMPANEALAARAVLALLAAPAVAVALWRGRLWAGGLQLSRQAALYSLVLVALGLYFLGVAGATLLIRHGPVDLAPAIRTGLLFASVLLLLVLITSGSVRAKAKLLLGRHVYPAKYDYAHEWRKFMQTLAFEDPEANAEGDTGASPLETRIIRACADALEVPGGALWVLDAGRPRLEATWNHRPAASLGAPLSASVFTDRQGSYRLLHGEALARSGLAAGDSRAWLAVPLPHRGRLLGFLILAQPRVARGLDAQDAELVLLIAYQCAGHLAEKQATTALQQEKQFSRFSRQYAFVAHDIKNLVSQLAVMLKNFDRHADNPEFQRDLRETVSNAVARMNGLLDRLSRFQSGADAAEDTATGTEGTGEGEAGTPPPTETPVAVAELITGEILPDPGAEAAPVRLSATQAGQRARAAVPAARLAQILRHLVANAREAGGANGPVWIYLDVSGRDLVVDVIDNGPGMSAAFVRDSLFTPFRSTKNGGFGLGVYQCRAFAREHGGDLEAISSPGSGTTMRLRLPLGTAEREPGSNDHDTGPGGFAATAAAR